MLAPGLGAQPGQKKDLGRVGGPNPKEQQKSQGLWFWLMVSQAPEVWKSYGCTGLRELVAWRR